MMSRPLALLFCLLALCVPRSLSAFPESGKWTLSLNSTKEYDGVSKNVYKDTRLFIRVQCSTPSGEHSKVRIGWIIREAMCWNEYNYIDSLSEALSTYYHKPFAHWDIPGFNASDVKYAIYEEVTHDCDGGTIFMQAKLVDVDKVSKNDKVEGRNGPEVSPASLAYPGQPTRMPQYIIDHDGDYLVVVHVQGTDAKIQFEATVDIELRGDDGFLSVVDWPLLPFYGAMCGLYVLMGAIWLVLCARHWRDLLRIQFWIGGVIFLGMLEKAMFVAEYENVKVTGSPTRALILAAELTSCAKRTLARMLVVIVSLGFGIVKPRLGPTLHRVVGVGLLYMGVASVEAYLRVMRPKNDLSAMTMVVGIPLAIIDSSICWWVFSALIQTTRTLRLRRNLVKLALYRHFTNALVLSVLASVVFMLWSIKYHKLEDCLTDWRNIWVDDAFWHLLFSVILIIIMFLWRPSQNNQRYAFTPLLDYDEDEESEDEGESDPFFKGKIQQRSSVKPTRASPKEAAATSDDPLKWIEENIPQSADADNPLPVLDSDEEIETTKFEINKME